jgi:PAS domain S-box-containing protein
MRKHGEEWREATATWRAQRSRVASAQFRLALPQMLRVEARGASLYPPHPLVLLITRRCPGAGRIDRPGPRHLAGVTRGSYMKARYAPLLISTMVGVLYWLMDATMDRYVFHGGSLWDSVLFDVPAMELYTRSLGLLFFVAAGALMTRISAKRRESEAALRGSEAKYRALMEDAGEGIALLDLDGNLVEVNNKAADLLGYTREELTQRDFRELLPPEERERAVASFEATLRQGSSSLGDVAVLGKDGRRVPAAVTASVIEVLGRKMVQAIFRDISERKRSEQALADRLRLEELRADVGVALGRGDTLPTLLQPCAEALVRHLGAAFARIWTLNEGEGILELQASAGMYTRLDGSRSRVPVARSKVGIIARERRPILTNAVIGDPEFIDQEWVKREGLVAFAGYPLILGDRLLGVMTIFAREPLSEITGAALASVAGQIALGIRRHMVEQALRRSEENLRSLSSELLSAQEKERGRIARELHDGVGQSLGSLKVRVEGILKQASRNEGNVDLQLMENLIPVVRGAMEEVRSISMGLRPSIIDSLGLVATISWFCREFQASHPDIRIEQEIDVGEEAIPDPLKIVIFRVLQEAFNNTARHSKADSLRLSLRRQEGRVSLAVEDNGQGFDPRSVSSPEAPRRGFGLVSMRERTELTGGSFSIESNVGKGTTVRASWPTSA